MTMQMTRQTKQPENIPAAAPATGTPDPRETILTAKQRALCIEAGEKYDICPELLEAIIEHESRGKWYVANGDCIGLMQVSRRWHTKRMHGLGYSNLYDEEANIMTGADLLSELLEKYQDVGTALMAYNGTKDAERRTTLTHYAQSVLDRSAELEEVHGKI